MSLADGDRLGRYEILSRLATGGMAEIFLAREHGVAGLERIVVVKRILPHLAGVLGSHAHFVGAPRPRPGHRAAPWCHYR